MSFLTEGELDEETRRGIHEIRERKKQRDDERRKKKRDNERLSAHHEVVIDDGKQEHDEEGLNIHQEGVIGHGELDGKKKHEEKEQQRTGRWPPALQLNDAGQSSGDGADSPGPDRPKVEHAVKQSLMGPQLDDFLRPDIEKYNTDDLIPMPRGVRRTLLGPKRYTLCELRDRCTHHPGHMLQVFDIVVKCLMHDGIAGPYMLVTSGNTTGPFIDVYGTVAVRDCLDNHQSYIFQRDRTNAQKIHTTGNFLSLMNPARGILARDCSIAFNIMIKAEKAHEDVTIVGGRVKAIWEYDICRMDRISSKNGEVIFLSSIWREGVEATIELDFIEVPAGGFHMQMRGRNFKYNGLYSFVNERCDCDVLISKPGKH